jgi:hypothetical protein
LEGLKEAQETFFVVVEPPLFVVDAVLSWLQKHLADKEEARFVLPHLWAIPLLSISTDKEKAFEASCFALSKVSKQVKPLGFEVFSVQQRDGLLVMPVSTQNRDSFVETIGRAKGSLEDMGFDCQATEPNLCVAFYDKTLESPFEPLITFVGNQLWLASYAHEPPNGFKRLKAFSLSGV